MQPTADTQTARDELFRRIGRNVVHFQYLEATLRSMIPALYNQGTLQELQANRDEISRKHEKVTLGTLANAYHERVYDKKVEDEAPPDGMVSEPGFVLSVRLDVTPERAAQRKLALMDLVAERNRLIHKDLLTVDLNSREACEEFSARLDEQYLRIQRQLEYLNSLRTRFRDMAVEFERFLDSEEFLALLRGERSET